MPGFDKEIAKLAQRILVNPRKIDYHTGVLATKVTPGARSQPWQITAAACQVPLSQYAYMCMPIDTATYDECRSSHCWACMSGAACVSLCGCPLTGTPEHVPFDMETAVAMTSSHANKEKPRP